jgi:hypothetical protein
MARLGRAQPFPAKFKAPPVVAAVGGDASLTPALGELSLVGQGVSLGFTINMPDEL